MSEDDLVNPPIPEFARGRFPFATLPRDRRLDGYYRFPRISHGAPPEIATAPELAGLTPGRTTGAEGDSRGSSQSEKTS